MLEEMKAAPKSIPVICAWCEREMKRGDLKAPMSHGICLVCMSGVSGLALEDLTHADARTLDEPPFGAIQLSGDGIVTAYNRRESSFSGVAPEAALGKKFFRDVAPCAAVREFEGELLKLRAAGASGRAKLRFVFKFARGSTLVEIAVTYDAPADAFTLLIRPVLTEPKL